MITNIYDDFELTEADYITAEQNGLSRNIVYQRFNVGWDKQEAVTKPKGNAGYLKRLQEEAAENGIKLTMSTISARKLAKWPEEDIVTVPKGKHRKTWRGYHDS